MSTATAEQVIADTVQAAQAVLGSITKAILFPVRFVYTLRTGRIGLNEDSARWYAAEGLPGSALALQALEWRNDGITDAEAASQMLGAGAGWHSWRVFRWVRKRS